MKKIALLLTLFLAAYTAKADGDFTINTGAGGIVHVKQNGTGTGSSWTDPYPELADALLEAKTNANIKEIWVAAGTYKPLHAADGSDNSRNKAFVLVNGLKIYGGFPVDANDTDHTSISTRGSNPLLNATILSGDLNGNDTGDLTTNKSDNAFHVVIGASIASDGKTILDGFTITGGYADINESITVNGKTFYNHEGSGIFNHSSSPTLTNLTISGNTAILDGGGISNEYDSSPRLMNLTISGNTAGYYGGGIYNTFSSSPTLTNLIISGNTSGDGGGICNTRNSSPTLTNLTISGNTASAYGGGINNRSSSSPKLTNSIVWGNSAPTGNSVDNDSDSSPTYNYSLVQDVTTEDTNGNLNGNLNPLFVSTATGNYRLSAASPLIDKGDNESYGPTLLSDLDLDGNPRLYGENIDLGAYECQVPPGTGSIVYIKQNGTGDGSSWTNASPELADALLAAKTNANIREIWVAAGTYKPLHIADGSDNSRNKAFVLVEGLKIYGGFPADANDVTHTSVETGRAPSLHATILSGDLNGDDTGDLTTNKSDNACHVVIGASIASDGKTILDGFTITGGNADIDEYISVNSQTFNNRDGSGILNHSSSPTLTNLTISGNTAGLDGGGISNIFSSPRLTNLTISGNTSSYFGGGIFNYGSSPTFTNLTISGNTAGDGGGICNYYSSPTLTNLTISGNTAIVYGGGINNRNSSSPKLTNSIVWGNSAPTGNSVDNDSDSSPTYNYSLVQDITTEDTNGNLNGSLDPLFVSTGTGNYRLLSLSPLIDKGNKDLYDGPDVDLDGNPRLYGASIDLGAYEYQPVPDGGGIVYIKQNGTGDGSSWANPYPQLADVLLEAKTNANIKEIWVAAGTYKPLHAANDGTPSDNPRDKAFVLVEGLKIYGGFPADANDVTHTSVQTGRAPSLHATILSGDLEGNDTDDLTANKSDNAYHVVIGADIALDSETILDGFTITGGNTGRSFSITVNGQTVHSGYGGGISNTYSSPTLTNLTISGNTANSGNGGGIDNYDHSSPTLTNLTISGNSANYGGGISNDDYSSPKLTNVTISGNSALNYGGGIYNNDHSSPTLTNLTISGNTAGYGGGIYNDDFSSPKLTNSIVWGNNARSGNNVYNFDNNSSPTYNYSLVQGEDLTGADTGNLDGSLDPLFVDWIDPSDDSWTATTTGNYRLLTASPLIEAGDNKSYETASERTLQSDVDLDGNPRLCGANIDLGAYEYQYQIVPDADGIVYIKQNGTGDGSSWTNASPELADALLVAKTNANIKEIWVAAGAYKPLYAANDGTPSTDPRDKAFVLVEGLKIYGGFPADANDADHTSVETGRAPSLHVTILSGDLDGDDDLTANKGDNACHVVIGANIPAGETILDGFTITGGNSVRRSGITVNGQTVYSGYGGGISNTYSSPTLTNLIISGNSVFSYGGGIDNYDHSSPTLTNLTISGNSAHSGGGMVNQNNSSPKLTNVTISGNSVNNYGGGIYNEDSSSPTLTNITISGNTASIGGGIYNSFSSPKLYNTIVWGNNARSGNNVYNADNNSSPTYDYSLVQGEDLTGTGTGNLDGSLDPLFVDWIDPSDDSWTTATTGNYRLLSASPLIDKGDKDLYDGPDVDLDGKPRLSGANIDLGAYEFSELIWTGLAGNNWAEPANWNFREVPNEASSVYIPGNLGVYPVLTEADFAAVKDIRFGPGAEIGRQDFLNYEKAYVQLDFSEASSRDRWYMLANPLQQLYAGDFSFGGYPGMDMKLFETDPEQDNKTVWNRITGLDKSFSAGDGFIVWLAPDPTERGSKGLIHSRGILELPYFDNINVPADVHWTHTYDNASKLSTFKGWKEENGLIVENEDTPETVVLRNNGAYLLAGQEVEKTLNFGQGQFAIAGNPYMSSIDFAKLQEANSSVITGTYYIWIGPGGTNSINPGSYAIYNALIGITTGRTGVELTDSIVPMQAFIVDKSEGATSTTLAFDLALIGVTDGSARLRSAAPQGDKLDIVASTGQAGVRTLVASRQEGGDSFASVDSRKLFAEINSIPEVYTLKPRANNEQVATAVNILGEITGETLVPLAISTTHKGELSFTFTGMDTYNARISLLDTETNTETELTDKEQYEYKFNYVPEQSGEKIVANENRFFIRLNKSFTGIEEIASEAVRIYAPYPGTLQVVSTHPLRQVRVYNLQGSLVYNTSAIQTNTQKVEGLAAGVYIVKAVSGNTVATEKVIVR